MTVNSRIAALAVLAMTLGLAIGCMRPVSVDSTWVDGADRTSTFGNVLVVGVSANYNNRCRYESRVVSNLRDSGVRAESSCAYLDSTDPLTVDTVKPVVQQLNADSVLVTELIGRERELVEGGSSETRGEAYYKPVGYGYAYRYPYYGRVGGYGAYGLPVTYVEFTAEQSAFAVETTVTVASNLYDVEGRAPVYSVQITAANQASKEAVLFALSDRLSQQLDRAGLLEPGATD